MNILAIETATARCSVALWIDGEVSESWDESTAAHSGLVLGMVRKLLERNGLRYEDLGLVAVDVGPGSFTGLRIGIGVAQGLGYSRQLPSIGIGSLAAMASVAPERPIIAALDARMGQVYWGVYQAGEALVSPRVDNPEDVTGELDKLTFTDPPLGVGNGWAAYADGMPGRIAGQSLEIAGPDVPEASQIARLAAGISSELYQSPLALSAAYVRNKVAEKSTAR